MPSSSSGRRLSVLQMVGLEGQGCGCMGGRGLAGGICGSVPHCSSSFADPCHFAFVISPVHQGEGLGGGDSGSSVQGSSRACFSVSMVLQLYVCGNQGIRRMETLNHFVVKTPFRMETTQLILRSVRREAWMVSVDLKDACLQVLIHPLSRKFLGRGQSFNSLQSVGNYRQFGEVVSDSISDRVVSGGQDRLADFLGFADSTGDRKVLLNCRRIFVFKRAVCEVLESSVGSLGLYDSSSPRMLSPPALGSVGSSSGVGFSGQGRSCFVGRLFSRGSSVVVCRRLSRGVCVSRVPPVWSNVLVRRLRSGLGGHGGRSIPVRSLVCGRVAPVDQRKRAHVSSDCSGSFGSSVQRQHHSFVLSPSSGGGGQDEVSSSQISSLEDSLLGRVGGDSPLSPVCDGEEQCHGRRSVSPQSSNSLGSEWTLHQEVFDSLRRRWPIVVDLFATSVTTYLFILCQCWTLWLRRRTPCFNPGTIFRLMHFLQWPWFVKS